MQTEQLKDLGRPIVEQAKTVGKEVNQLGRVTRDEAGEGLTMVKDSANNLAARSRTQVRRVEQKAEAAIRSRPFRATALAAVVGTAVGLLLGATIRR